MVAHERFVITKELRASPDRVWRAFTNPAQKRAWFVEMDEPGWETLDYACDPRVGGREHGRFRYKGVVHGNETVYLDRAEGERLVFAYTMDMDGRRHSASLTTVELAPDGGGTRLTYTEQAAFFDGSDGLASRRAGCEALLDQLERHLTLPA